MDIKTIFEDGDLLVVDKPAGVVVIPDLIGELIKQKPELGEVEDAPRFGVVHRLDKDTSGVLLVAKTSESLIFLQKQFINREVEKKYVCLVEGVIKEDSGEIKTFIGRSPGDFRKQIVVKEGKREALTKYKVLERFEGYTLLEVQIETGRRHQIRCHFSYLQHPIAGDKLYGFKNSKVPEGLTRQFLHASYLKIKLLNGEVKEFYSELPEDLKHVKIIRTVQ